MGSYAAPSVTTQSLSFRRPEPTPNLRGWLSVVAGCVPQDGAIDELDDSRVMFGYVRCIMPDGRPKVSAHTNLCTRTRQICLRADFSVFFACTSLC